MFVATDPEPDRSDAPEPDIEEWFADVNKGGRWITGTGCGRRRMR